MNYVLYVICYIRYSSIYTVYIYICIYTYNISYVKIYVYIYIWYRNPPIDLPFCLF